MNVVQRQAPAFTVAIDGPAASGKGTLARRLASRFNLAYLDTGALYRATAFLTLEAEADPSDVDAAEGAARRLGDTLRAGASILSDPRLRSEAVSQAASVVAALKPVRDALLAFQRDFAARPPLPVRGTVLDGRDIGTVVCPGAPCKLFVTASVETRAKRRVKELRQAGAPVIYEAVLQDMKLRDARDTERRDAPLTAAPDAIVIDTTTLDADAAFARACEIIARTLPASD